MESCDALCGEGAPPYWSSEGHFHTTVKKGPEMVVHKTYIRSSCNVDNQVTHISQSGQEYLAVFKRDLSYYYNYMEA